jgi:hypothetical protein
VLSASKIVLLLRGADELRERLPGRHHFVVVVGGLHQKTRSVAVPGLERESRLRVVQRFLVDNPVVVLVGVLVLLFVLTDLVNRNEVGEPFVTWNQLSTTFLVAAPLGMIAAGQTLVMLTGGVDLSVALTATAARSPRGETTGPLRASWPGSQSGSGSTRQDRVGIFASTR